MTMKPEFKKVWVEALRSGEFKQGQLALRERDGRKYEYCCIGVACMVWQREKLGAFIVEEYGNGEIGVGYPDGGELDPIELPSGVLDEVGLSPADQSTLIGMNDTELNSFAEIADYIEANL